MGKRLLNSLGRIIIIFSLKQGCDDYLGTCCELRIGNQNLKTHTMTQTQKKPWDLEETLS